MSRKRSGVPVSATTFETDPCAACLVWAHGEHRHAREGFASCARLRWPRGIGAGHPIPAACSGIGRQAAPAQQVQALGMSVRPQGTGGALVVGRGAGDQAAPRRPAGRNPGPARSLGSRPASAPIGTASAGVRRARSRKHRLPSGLAINPRNAAARRGSPHGGDGVRLGSRRARLGGRIGRKCAADAASLSQ